MSKVGREFTVTYTTLQEHTFEEGYGVMVEALYEDDGRISEIDVIVCPIREADVRIIGNVPCVPIPTNPQHSYMPVENFQHVGDLWEDDTHDLRSRYFETEDEAEAHAEFTRKRWDHPQPWESFVKL